MVIPEYSSQYSNGALKREQLKSQHKKRCRKTSPNICTDGQTKPMGCTRVNLKQQPDTAFLPVSLCLNLPMKMSFITFTNHLSVAENLKTKDVLLG